MRVEGVVGEGTPTKITLDMLKNNCTEFGTLDRSVTICLKNCHNRPDYYRISADHNTKIELGHPVLEFVIEHDYMHNIQFINY